MFTGCALSEVCVCVHCPSRWSLAKLLKLQSKVMIQQQTCVEAQYGKAEYWEAVLPNGLHATCRLVAVTRNATHETPNLLTGTSDGLG